MATALRKVREEKNKDFTVRDLLNIYYGKSDYGKYDNSACQWNQFVKDFCNNPRSDKYNKKLKVAAILWKEVRESSKEKIYTSDLIKKNEDVIKPYQKIV